MGCFPSSNLLTTRGGERAQGGNRCHCMRDHGALVSSHDGGSPMTNGKDAKRPFQATPVSLNLSPLKRTGKDGGVIGPVPITDAPEHQLQSAVSSLFARLGSSGASRANWGSSGSDSVADIFRRAGNETAIGPSTKQKSDLISRTPSSAINVAMSGSIPQRYPTGDLPHSTSLWALRSETPDDKPASVPTDIETPSTATTYKPVLFAAVVGNTSMTSTTTSTESAVSLGPVRTQVMAGERTHSSGVAPSVVRPSGNAELESLTQQRLTSGTGRSYPHIRTTSPGSYVSLASSHSFVPYSQLRWADDLTPGVCPYISLRKLNAQQKMSPRSDVTQLSVVQAPSNLTSTTCSGKSDAVWDEPGPGKGSIPLMDPNGNVLLPYGMSKMWERNLGEPVKGSAWRIERDVEDRLRGPLGLPSDVWSRNTRSSSSADRCAESWESEDPDGICAQALLQAMFGGKVSANLIDDAPARIEKNFGAKCPPPLRETVWAPLPSARPHSPSARAQVVGPVTAALSPRSAPRAAVGVRTTQRAPAPPQKGAFPPLLVPPYRVASGGARGKGNCHAPVHSGPMAATGGHTSGPPNTVKRGLMQQVTSNDAHDLHWQPRHHSKDAQAAHKELRTLRCNMGTIRRVTSPCWISLEQYDRACRP